MQVGDLGNMYYSIGLKSTLGKDADKANKELEKSLAKAAKEAEKKAAEISKHWQKVGDDFVAVGQRMSLALTAPIVAFAAFGVKAAADAEEMRNRFHHVFGGMEKDLEQWADTTADEINRGKTSIMTMMALFGAMGKGMEMNQNQVIEFSKSMTKLVYDLQSFYDIPEEEITTKLQGAIMGKFKGMKTLGIAINEEMVDLELTNMGVDPKKVDEGAKAMARYAVIVRLTKVAQGDAARTADSFTNAMRGLEADVSAVKRSFGEQFIPYVRMGMQIVEKLAKGINSMSNSQKAAVTVFLIFLAAIGPTLIMIGSLINAVIQLKGAYIALKLSMAAAGKEHLSFISFMAANPYLAVAVAITAIVIALGLYIYSLGKAVDQQKEFANVMNKTTEEYRKQESMMRAKMSFGGFSAPNLTWIDRAKASLQAMVEVMWEANKQGLSLGSMMNALAVSQAKWAAEAQKYEMLGDIREFLDLADMEMVNLSRSMNEQSQVISDLTDEYDKLAGEVERLVELEEELDDMNRTLKGDTLDLLDAQDEYNKVLADPKSSARDIARAALAVENARDRFSDDEKAMKEKEVEQAELTTVTDTNKYTGIADREARMAQIPGEKQEHLTIYDKMKGAYDEIKNRSDYVTAQAKIIAAGHKDSATAWENIARNAEYVAKLSGKEIPEGLKGSYNAQYLTDDYGNIKDVNAATVPNTVVRGGAPVSVPNTGASTQMTPSTKIDASINIENVNSGDVGPVLDEATRYQDSRITAMIAAQRGYKAGG